MTRYACQEALASSAAAKSALCYQPRGPIVGGVCSGDGGQPSELADGAVIGPAVSWLALIGTIRYG